MAAIRDTLDFGWVTISGWDGYRNVKFKSLRQKLIKVTKLVQSLTAW